MSDSLKAVAELRFPADTDARLQFLMSRNTEGDLTSVEREELEALVELSELMALLRAKALRLLGARSFQQVIADIHEKQRRRGFEPPTREQVDVALRAERESWGDA